MADHIQWFLLRGGPIPADIQATSPRIKELATSLADADFKFVLLSSESRAALSSASNLFDGLNVAGPSSESSANVDPIIKLITAIALLHSFVQINWTGPDLSFTPLDVLDASSSSIENLNAASLPFLTLHGEPAYHLSQHSVFFLLARRLFLSLEADSNALPTLPLWLLRLHLVHLSLLDEPVSQPETLLDSIKTLLDNPAVQADQDLIAQIHLELGLLHYSLGTDKHANQEFLTAAKASGLEFELTGALGKKTKYQVAAHSQLVLLAESRKRDGENDEVEKESAAEEKAVLPESLLLNDDTLLEETEFTKVTRDTSSTTRLAHLDPSAQPALHPLDQSLLISFCLAQSNNTPSSGLTAQQMMPFLSRVISHPRNWSVHTTALLLRSRLEATRSRTVERSTLQLQALIDQMPTSDSEPKERLRYFHQLPLPSKWEMERELAKRFMSVGVIRSALEIFTRLEMWEDAIMCMQKMDKEEEAIDIVKDLLAGKKVESDLMPTLGRANISESRKQKLTAAREGKLWCLLGDLCLGTEAAQRDPSSARETAVEYYEKGWEVSEHTSSRAMRSLGSLYMGTQEYEKAIACFNSALEINPLYARVWFTLGVAFLRLEKWKDARDAFRKQVGVDEDDAEGWNNLAAVYLRLEEEGFPKDQLPPPVSYENKLLAFRALRQGLRYAYANWRMWQNYMIVAIDVGELSEAARAMTRIVEELANRDPEHAIDADVLDKLVDSVTRDDFSLSKDESTKVVPKTSNEGFGLLPIVERLFDVVILPRISDSPRVWRTHARLLRWKEDWEGAMEDYLRAWRFGPVQDETVERDLGKWKDAVGELEDLVAVLSVLGPKAKAAQEEQGEKKKKGDWKFQARGLVRTFMGRTKESFEGEKDWQRLQDLMEELKRSD
ncbi:TPR repeat-containing protein [Cryptococcus neoformans var. grubii Br795]|uniref:TPR repeat-containing protein n=1 Tax=Cryptococcus neoformans Tu259-1 TaxID=1230072 RepID=A0A854Q8X4_CRYNE|nr:TPR repeat-containing protein [Cryptococcus neoformans var. grubii 125.91]OXG15988.1 TPR repeat-containing protein [Cryptococcus neoformans var. grubii Tu259-1]OXG29470.1 TPR repeat-containing protein [Cryptococcus neoformans var. grubii Bt15]OXG47425.1 TPR repeat-containing protein [Cryptococcus neoformans var. grubii Th84]OXG76095.1 TPR repeat-containing protein [Cryptococcus neoformans var. grubii MW-RSA36]OXG77899.1 TPR repeat-containing protein [Cryptococcus neoformans var. grubii Br79